MSKYKSDPIPIPSKTEDSPPKKMSSSGKHLHEQRPVPEAIRKILEQENCKNDTVSSDSENGEYSEVHSEADSDESDLMFPIDFGNETNLVSQNSVINLNINPSPEELNPSLLGESGAPNSSK